MTQLHQPHDRLFKQSLKERAVALAFLKAHLPTMIYDKLDLSTLHPIESSYLTPELSAIHSDVVLACQIDGKPGYIPILLLIEHQSTPDKQLAFRVLDYTVGLMRDHLKAGYPEIPLVLPVCLYHGECSPYPYSTKLSDCFADPELASQLIFREVSLIDLTVLTEETLQQHGAVAVMELLFQAIWKKQFLPALRKLVASGILSQTLDKTTPDYLTSMLKYSLNQSEGAPTETADEIIQLFIESQPDQREMIMTFADQLRAEGLQSGILQGTRNAAFVIARKLLARGIDRDFVQETVGLSEAELALLESESEEE